MHLPQYDKMFLSSCVEADRAGLDFVVCGCDPGPTHSAFVILRMDKSTGKISCSDALYLSNECLEVTSMWSPCRDLSYWGYDVFAYERVACQGRIVGKTVFDTAAMSGVIRHVFRAVFEAKNGVSFAPSMWRYIVTGVGSAKDSDTKAALEDAGIENLDSKIKEEMKLAKKRYNLTKPCGCHLRDAAGVALATFMAEMRIGLDSFKETFLWMK